MKHLPELGFNPIVVSSWIEKKNKWTPSDSSLAKEVPSSIQVHRLQDNEEFAVLSNTKINPQRTKGIVEIGKEIIKSSNIKLIYVSLSPFGDLPAALELGKHSNLPVIADLRDPWALDEFQTHRSYYHKMKEVALMGKLLKQCDHVIMNTPESARLLSQRFNSISPDKVSWITNGYDQEDFQEETESPILDKSFYNIIHTGTFHTDYALRQKRQKLLNSLLGRTDTGLNVMGRTPSLLLEALATIKRNQPDVFSQIRVTFAGVASSEDKLLVEKHGLSESVTSTGYIDHDSCIRYTKEANLLFLPLHDIAKGRRCSIVPGKTYEYMASDATILGALPDGDAKDFVRGRANCHLCLPDQSEKMASSILDEVKKWQSGKTTPSPNLEFVKQFERRILSQKLANTFVQVLSEHKR